MVRLLIFVILLIHATPALALFGQTQADLNVLRDALEMEVQNNDRWAQDLAPMLVAPPQNLWQESRGDFSASVFATLRSAWTQPGELIPCSECGQQRTEVTKDHQVRMSSGDISSQDLAAILADQRYVGAKSIAFIKETARGVELRIIRLSDTAIVYHRLADSTENLDSIRPRMHLVDEMERRKRGESLAYIFIELGFYPKPLTHISFLEQWGPGNHNLTGVSLSLIGPLVSLGATYRYILPAKPKLHLGATLFFPLQQALASGSGNGKFVILHGTIQYAFSSTFGVFGAINTDSTVTVGISLYNPIWFPFML